MFHIRKIAGTALSAAGLALTLLASTLLSPAGGARAAPTTILYNFGGPDTGHFPGAGVIRVGDGNGDIYGTAGGGTNNAGVLYRVTRAGVETVLHNFGGPGDGGGPQSELMMDARGLIYGTTRFGGTGSASCGTVYRMGPSGGGYKVLYSFPGGKGGCQPESRLVMDKDGNLYGMSQGGADGLGLVFKVAPGGHGTVLKQFAGKNGAYPPSPSGLIMGADGNLYGTTTQGGAHGGGIVFKMTPDGTETVLHSFQCCFGDGQNPAAGVIMDKAGNLFGTLKTGGAFNVGSVFKLAPDKRLTVLYSFPGGRQGQYPSSGVVMDAQGNLFGTASGGRNLPSCGSFGGGLCGVVFKVTQGGQGFLVHLFNGVDGWSPVGDLAIDRAGNLYGVTYYGGTSDAGVLFKVTR